MAYATTDLETLQAALASGVRTVTINGQTVTYASLDELRLAIDIVRAELGLTTAQNAKRVTFARFARS